jgi:hypothetical protein
MNRQQRREFMKKHNISADVMALLMASGFKQGNAKEALAEMAAIGAKMHLKEGQRVRLDTTAIKSHPDHHKKSPEYRQFVDDNAGTIFTVVYDERYTNPPTLVCLEEDETKWLWYEGHLKKVDVS